MNDRTRDRILELIREMQKNTVANGCTPGEAAKFAAKVQEWMEKYQVNEAELKATGQQQSNATDEVEIVENILATGRKVHNPGFTAVVSALARGVACKTIILPAGWKGRKDAAYGIVGDQMDCDYVCQVACTVVPALQIMATLEGKEHGCDGSELIRWCNQYLEGAAIEIHGRLVKERQDRADQKIKDYIAAGGCTAIAPITGVSIYDEKQKNAEEAFKMLYPTTKTIHSRSRKWVDGAHEAGRRAGKNVGLNISLENK